MRYAYVLSEWHRHVNWSRTRLLVEVAGPLDVLKNRLRPWALEIIGSARLNDGEYCAYLVELDPDGGYDTYLALEIDEIFWFHEQEYVPAS